MYPKLSAVAAVLLISGALALSLFAEDSRPLLTAGNSEGATSASVLDVEISIRFFDKRVYYPESDIPLKVTLTNKGARTWRFKLAEDRAFSLSIDARTPANRSLELSDDYKRSLAAARPVFYREMALDPGEEYSFVESLSHYIMIKEPGSFTLRASFWPELIAQAPATGSTASAGNSAPVSSTPAARMPAMLSNVLILTVRPSMGLPPAADLVNPDTGEVLKPLPLPPDEVVSRTIIARQRSRWNEFFLYLDVESLLSRSESRKRAYDKESDEGRRRMIERYKADLRDNVIDSDIVTIPASFEIIETRYSAERGFVKVIEKFEYRGFTMVKEYDYELVRRDGVWFIEAYTVLNKGTE